MNYGGERYANPLQDAGAIALRAGMEIVNIDSLKSILVCRGPKLIRILLARQAKRWHHAKAANQRDSFMYNVSASHQDSVNTLSGQNSLASISTADLYGPTLTSGFIYPPPASFIGPSLAQRTYAGLSSNSADAGRNGTDLAHYTASFVWLNSQHTSAEAM